MKLLLYVKYLNSDFSCFYFNNLVILGPKKENGNYYTYCYLSQPNIKYCDPAKHGLKYNNFNSDEKKDLICLQIFQLKYKMDEKELDDLIEKAKKKNII